MFGEQTFAQLRTGFRRTYLKVAHTVNDFKKRKRKESLPPKAKSGTGIPDWNVSMFDIHL